MDTAVPLVGRAAEFDWLVGWAYRSRMPGVLVRGEPGIGKTRLVSELTERARLRRVPRVLVGRCAELAREALPFAALTEILRALLDQYDAQSRQAVLGSAEPVLVNLLPELAAQRATVPGQVGRLQLFEAVLDVLRRGTENRPTLLVFEDVHWMPVSGLELLDYLLRAHLEHVRFVVTARDGERAAPELGRLVEEAVRDHLLDVVTLDPLPLSAVQELTAAILGRPPSTEVVERIHRLSGGNPFFVEELARHEAGGGGLPLPRLLTELLTVAARPQSDDGRTVLQALAAAGTAVPHLMLMAVADLSAEQLEPAVREVLHTGLVEVTTDGLGYRFRHELARQACYAGLLPAERIRMHGRCADWLARSVRHGASADLGLLARLVHQYHCAGDDDDALEWALTATDDAERAGAGREALDFSRRAFDLWAGSSRPPAGRVHLALRAARLAGVVAEHAVALRLVEAALAQVDPAEEPLVAGELEERRAWYRLLTLSEPIPEDCRRAVELIPAEPPTPLRARVLATHSRLLALSGRTQEAVQAAEEGLATAMTLGAEAERAAALISLGAANAVSSTLHQAVELLWQGCELARTVDSVDDLATGYGLLLTAELLTDADLTPVLDLAARGNELLARRGRREGHLDLYASIAQLELGRWPQAHETARRVTGGGAPFAQWLLALLAVRRGEQASPARNVLSPQRLETIPLPAGTWCGEWLAETELLHGRPAEAAAIVAQLLHRLEGRPEDPFAGRLLTLGLRAQADRITAGRDLADEGLVADATAAAAALAARARSIRPSPFDESRSPSGTAVPDAATWDAEWSRLTGPSEPDAWGRAVDAWLALSRPYFAVYALWRQAEALMEGRAQRRSVGPIVLHGMELAQEIGAIPLLRELERLALRAHLPMTPAGDGGSKAGSARPGPLTRREVDVLRLAAQGLSNRAIADVLVVSPKTVDTHLSHVLMKLDVHDRIAAANRGQRLGLLN